MLVHTIWSGGKLPPWALEGLETIRKATPRHDHLLWAVPKEKGTSIKAPRWNTMQLSQLWLQDFKFLDPYDDDTLYDIIQFELKYGGFSAIKDLLEFVVLYLYGGLYLDLSMRSLTSEDRGAAIQKTIPMSAWDPSTETSEVRLPQVDSGLLVARRVLSPSYELYVTDSARDSTYRDMTTWDKRDNPHAAMGFPHLDVWACYAKPQSTVMKNAAAFMISRYMTLVNSSLGTAPSDQTITVPDNQRSRFTFTTVGRYTELGAKTSGAPEDKEYRNQIIGKTVMSAIYDALAARYVDERTQQVPQSQWDGLIWKTAKADGGYACPALGLTKLHKGSWR
ncbi:glycosyltransferase family 32 protein [Hyalangium gracile]|uniref:hypothetical protein n=1 Tax=Hyalangium gracile TaxID=394092 RepID=UPI001CCCC182|nr:hypothetical protein [Hyalangium gracile]